MSELEGDLNAQPIGHVHRHAIPGGERISFRYDLFRRMVFNICIANVDDDLRNHGFLREASGWTLSPAYDLNPVPPTFARGS